MSSQVFANHETIIAADWLNDIDIDVFGPDHYGAVGNGVTDDLAAINAALAAANGKWIRGNPTKIYAISGNLTLPSTTRMRDIKFKQLAPNDGSRRTIYASGATHIHLENVSVDLNGDGSNGTVASSAGMWFSSVTKLILNNCEVFGNGYTNGIVTASCNDVRMYAPYIHDMTHGTSTSANPLDDRINGIWTLSCNRVVITAPIIKNLLGRWSGQAAFNRYTRGITDGGSKDYHLIAPTIENVDQGYDNTGDNGALRFTVQGGSATNCYTYGFKVANCPQYGSFIGIMAYRCGKSGFVASPPGVNPTSPQVRYIEYIGCQAIDTGYGGHWVAAATVAGFRVEASAAYPDFPRNVRYIGCTSHDSTGNMEYGYFNDAVVPGGAGDEWVETVQCTSKGGTAGDYYGMNQGIARYTLITPTSISNSSETNVPLDTPQVNRCQAVVDGANGTINMLRSGLYSISANIEFAANATGIREVTLYRAGAQVGRQRMAAYAGSNNFLNIQAVVEVEKNDLIQIKVLQNSGGALDLVTASLQIALISPGRGRL